jgi:hypothetical protein
MFCYKSAFEALFTGKYEASRALQIGYDLAMHKLRLRRQLRDAYRFPGFVPAIIILGVFGDPQARVVSLKRRQKNSLRNLWSVAW